MRNTYEQRVQRRGELRAYLGKDEWDRRMLDKLLAQEQRQAVAKMACRTIGYHLARSVQHAGWVRAAAHRVI